MKRVMMVLVGAVSSACGVSATVECRETCEKIYAETECNIQRPGTTRAERIEYCRQQCVTAFSKMGELGTYNPEEITPWSEVPVLENRAQAQAWTDCVLNRSCSELEENYCAPIW